MKVLQDEPTACGSTAALATRADASLSQASVIEVLPFVLENLVSAGQRLPQEVRRLNQDSRSIYDSIHPYVSVSFRSPVEGRDAWSPADALQALSGLLKRGCAPRRLCIKLNQDEWLPNEEPDITDFVLAALATFQTPQPQLTEIWITGCCQLTPTIAAAIVRAAPKLTALALQGPAAVGAAAGPALGLAALIASAPSLERLSLSDGGSRTYETRLVLSPAACSALRGADVAVVVPEPPPAVQPVPAAGGGAAVAAPVRGAEAAAGGAELSADDADTTAPPRLHGRRDPAAPRALASAPGGGAGGVGAGAGSAGEGLRTLRTPPSGLAGGGGAGWVGAGGGALSEHDVVHGVAGTVVQGLRSPVGLRSPSSLARVLRAPFQRVASWGKYVRRRASAAAFVACTTAGVMAADRFGGDAGGGNGGGGGGADAAATAPAAAAALRDQINAAARSISASALGLGTSGRRQRDQAGAGGVRPVSATEGGAASARQLAPGDTNAAGDVGGSISSGEAGELGIPNRPTRTGGTDGGSTSSGGSGGGECRTTKGLPVRHLELSYVDPVDVLTALQGASQLQSLSVVSPLRRRLAPPRYAEVEVANAVVVGNDVMGLPYGGAANGFAQLGGAAAAAAAVQGAGVGGGGFQADGAWARLWMTRIWARRRQNDPRVCAALRGLASMKGLTCLVMSEYCTSRAASCSLPLVPTLAELPALRDLVLPLWRLGPEDLGALWRLTALERLVLGDINLAVAEAEEESMMFAPRGAGGGFVPPRHLLPPRLRLLTLSRPLSARALRSLQLAPDGAAEGPEEGRAPQPYTPTDTGLSVWFQMASIVFEERDVEGGPAPPPLPAPCTLYGGGRLRAAAAEWFRAGLPLLRRRCARPPEQWPTSSGDGSGVSPSLAPLPPWAAGSCTTSAAGAPVSYSDTVRLEAHERLAVAGIERRYLLGPEEPQQQQQQQPDQMAAAAASQRNPSAATAATTAAAAGAAAPVAARPPSAADADLAAGAGAAQAVIPAPQPPLGGHGLWLCELAPLHLRGLELSWLHLTAADLGVVAHSLPSLEVLSLRRSCYPLSGLPRLAALPRLHTLVLETGWWDPEPHAATQTRAAAAMSRLVLRSGSTLAQVGLTLRHREERVPLQQPIEDEEEEEEGEEEEEEGEEEEEEDNALNSPLESQLTPPPPPPPPPQQQQQDGQELDLSADRRGLRGLAGAGVTAPAVMQQRYLQLAVNTMPVLWRDDDAGPPSGGVEQETRVDRVAAEDGVGAGGRPEAAAEVAASRLEATELENQPHKLLALGVLPLQLQQAAAGPSSAGPMSAAAVGGQKKQQEKTAQHKRKHQKQQRPCTTPLALPYMFAADDFHARMVRGAAEAAQAALRAVGRDPRVIQCGRQTGGLWW